MVRVVTAKAAPTEIQQRIVRILDREPMPQSVSEIVQQTGLSNDRVRRQLVFLLETGVVLKHDIYYRLANQS